MINIINYPMYLLGRFLKQPLQILIILLFIIYTSPSYAHGGEEHVHEEDKKITLSNTKTQDKVVKIQKDISLNDNNFKFFIEQSKKDIFQNDKVNFKIYVNEIIEGSFFNDKKIELKNISLKIDDNIIIPNNKDDNTYFFDYIFKKDGENKVIISAETNNNLKINFDLNINVINVPINYLPYTLDFILISFMIIIIVIFNSKSNNLKQKILFNSVLLLLLTISIYLISISTSNKIKIVKNELNSDVTNNDSNKINISKETQLLFNISTKKVKNVGLTKGINVTGIIKNFPELKADIISPFAGKVFLNHIHVGAKVIKDQILGYVEQTPNINDSLSIRNSILELQLKNSEIESKIKVAELNIENSKKEKQKAKDSYDSKKIQFEKQIKQVEEDSKLVKIEYEREKELYNSGYSSIKKLQNIENKMKRINLELEIMKKQQNYAIDSDLEKRIRESELEIKSYKENSILYKKQLDELNKSQKNTNNKVFNILAPIDGKITRIDVPLNNQQEVNKVLLTIVNSEKMILQAEVPEDLVQKVSDYKEGEFKVSPYDDIFKIDGITNRFLHSEGTIDPQKRTFHILFEIDNKENKFKNEMFTNITLNSSKKSKYIAIKKDYIFEDLGRKYVYVFEGGEFFEKREIKTGKENQEYIEVIDGLKVGEKIAVNGLYQLNNSNR
ncbi:MAG: efflux RND transporter periplasmic adaptor subunit [Cyanobacteriota bacterium]